MRRLLRLLCLLGVNAVPGGGFFLAGWSGPTMLVLYWCETLAGAVLTAMLLAGWRRAARSRPDAPDDRTFRAFRSQLLAVIFVFTLVQGAFLAFLFWLSMDGQGGMLIDAPGISRGIAGIGICLFANFLVDVFGLSGRSFEWIRGVARTQKARVVVMQVTVILGGGGALGGFGSVRGFIAVFIFFKVLMDVVLWWWPRHEADTLREWTAPTIAPSRD